MKVLACYSIKGGVGKTAIAVNLAYWAAASGLRTLLIDLDPQGASSFYFRVKPAGKNWSRRFFKAYEALLRHIKASDFDGLDVIPAHLGFRKFDVLLETFGKRRSRLRRVLKGMKREYDLVVLDCPPSIGNLSEGVFTAADAVLVPVVPTTLSVRTFEQLRAFFKDKGYSRRRILPLFSMVQVQKKLHRQTMAEMRQSYPRFLRSTIPFSMDVERMGLERAPINCFAPTRPANRAFMSLWDELEPLLRP